MKLERMEHLTINEQGDKLPITLSSERHVFYIDVDGVNWIQTKNEMHAVVMFEMMKDHITQYMQYKLTTEA